MTESSNKPRVQAGTSRVPEIPFPASIPDTYPRVEDEPRFDPAVHLALEKPSDVVSLARLGYDAKIRGAAPTDLGVAGPFRILSAVGVRAMQRTAATFRRLNARTEGDPLAAYIKPRGPAYSSEFIRDFCACAQVNEFFSEIAGVELIGHPMPTVRATLVYAPADIEKTRQGWHLDTIGFACVIALHDPNRLDGGRFQYFTGTRAEVAQHCGCAEQDLMKSVGRLTELPADRVRSLAFPAPGYGVLMQGNYVLHRGEPLARPAERVMFVPGYLATDPAAPDVTHWSEIRSFNSPVVVAEYARYKAWRAQTKLATFVREASLEGDEAELRAALVDALNELAPLVDELSANPSSDPD